MLVSGHIKPLIYQYYFLYRSKLYTVSIFLNHSCKKITTADKDGKMIEDTKVLVRASSKQHGLPDYAHSPNSKYKNI